MTQWNFSLRTMFVVMLVVASFCTGWLSKERWDKPPAMSPTRARREVQLLTNDFDRTSSVIYALESQLKVGTGGLEEEFQRVELARAIAVRDEILQRFAQVKASLGGTSIPLWIVKAALLVSTLVLSCAVGIRIGKHLAQHSSSVGDN